ncbi:MAG TPA: hypothetical protein VJO99_15470, partial [Burkholderiaceae bacterium]|nr:hypothetical protein [Burkholderiaceae bacterium]
MFAPAAWPQEFGRCRAVRLGAQARHRTAPQAFERDELALSSSAAFPLPPRSRLEQAVFQALCFGYFYLGQQMKVTRRPGGTGGLPPKATKATMGTQRSS